MENLIAVGGKTDGAAEGSKTVLGDRTNNAPEPVCFWSLPQEWYDELIHSFFAKLILDLTPLDAKFALCALRNRVGYAGVAFNADHVKLMEDRLISHLKKEMKDSASPLFNAAYAEAVGARVPATSSEPPNPNPKAKAKPKPKPVPKPKPDPTLTQSLKTRQKQSPLTRVRSRRLLCLTIRMTASRRQRRGLTTTSGTLCKSSGCFGLRPFPPQAAPASGCFGLCGCAV